METIAPLISPMLTLGCRLVEGIMTVKFSVPLIISLVIEMLNTTQVSPAGTVTLNGPE